MVLNNRQSPIQLTSCSKINSMYSSVQTFSNAVSFPLPKICDASCEKLNSLLYYYTFRKNGLDLETLTCKELRRFCSRDKWKARFATIEPEIAKLPAFACNLTTCFMSFILAKYFDNKCIASGGNFLTTVFKYVACASAASAALDMHAFSNSINT